IDPCKFSNGLCGKNAVCNKTGPGQHECVCHQGYRGDGVVCTAIDPCQTNNGNCPNNTQCNYTGPGKVCLYIIKRRQCSVLESLSFALYVKRQPRKMLRYRAIQSK
ncbi:stabilin-2 isoform X3, partial [Paramuricea clavata]